MPLRVNIILVFRSYYISDVCTVKKAAWDENMRPMMEAQRRTFVSGTLDAQLILGLWRNSLVLMVILAVKLVREATGLSLVNGMSKWI